MSIYLPFNGYVPSGSGVSGTALGGGYPELGAEPHDPYDLSWSWARQGTALIDTSNPRYISWYHAGGDTGDAAYVFTPSNTTDPTIEAGFTFLLADTRSQVGVVVVGSTGVCKYVIDSVVAGEMPYQRFVKKTALTNVFADETYAQTYSATSRGGVLWLRMKYDATGNSLTGSYSGDGVQWLPIAASSQDIGDIVSMGIVSQVGAAAGNSPSMGIFSVREL